MYTQCPKCKTQRPVSVEELRSSGGMLTCYTCSSTFDALNLLSKGYAPSKKKKQVVSDIQDDEVISEFNVNQGNSLSILQDIPWGVASGFCLLIFIFQLYFFEGYNLTQNKKLRPWVEKLCAPLGCQLPVYKNLDEITLLYGSLEPADDEQFIFKMAFTNQSTFTQKKPSLKLILVDYTGTDFAERIFYPDEFPEQESDLIEPDMSSEITLNIASPETKVGGYRFELI